MPTRSEDPVGNYNFRLEVDGFEGTNFSEISGLSIETEVITYRTGGGQQDQKLPGRNSFGDITLKRGYTKATELWEWYKTVLNGEVPRRDASIIVLDEKFEEYLRFNLANTWPRKYVGPLLNASGNEVAIEELVLVCERIALVT